MSEVRRIMPNSLPLVIALSSLGMLQQVQRQGALLVMGKIHVVQFNEDASVVANGKLRFIDLGLCGSDKRTRFSKPDM